MSGQHTQGRLVVRGEWLIPEAHSGRTIGGSSNHEKDRDEYAHYIGSANGKRRYHNNEANARRLAACWNFCLGVDTSGLEAIQGGMHGLLLQGADEQDELGAARALLTEALGIVDGVPSAYGVGLVDRIRAFLKGGA